MPRQRPGSLELKNGVWHARVTEVVNGAAPRPWYALETADEALAQRTLTNLLAEVAAREARERAAGPAPPPMPRFEPYARDWLKKRTVEGVGMVDSESGWL